jgi:thiosulfate/3-mercaptopyruvate sulfurtransferase
MGHEEVRLLNGGMQQWSREGRPVESGNVRVAGTRFEGQARHEMTVTTAELVRDLEHSGTCVLVDARDAGRFRGEVEPIDAVAGHVPGARNLPYSQSLTESGTWKERAELEALWSAALGEDRHDGWIAMCGSGVTACHLAISALEAGYREPRLYVGSWSEWIRDPDRPVAPGQGPT